MHHTPSWGPGSRCCKALQLCRLSCGGTPAPGSTGARRAAKPLLCPYSAARRLVTSNSNHASWEARVVSMHCSRADVSNAAPRALVNSWQLASHLSACLCSLHSARSPATQQRLPLARLWPRNSNSNENAVSGGFEAPHFVAPALSAGSALGCCCPGVASLLGAMTLHTPAWMVPGTAFALERVPGAFLMLPCFSPLASFS